MQKCEEITAFISGYQPLFFLFKTNGKTQQHINIHIYSICGSVTQPSAFFLLYYTHLVLMRALVEDKGHSSIPRLFQHLVPQALLVRTVVPMGEVTVTVSIIVRLSCFSAIHTAATAKPNTGGEREAD